MQIVYKIKLLTLALLGVVSMTAFSQTLTTNKTETLTNKSIVDLSKAGLGKTLIINKIKNTACKFDLSTTELVSLKKQGISEDILNAMMEKGEESTKESDKKTVTNSVAAKSDRVNATSSGITVPETLNFIHSYDPVLKKATPLEKGLAQFKAKSTGLGSNTFFELDGVKSPIRLLGDKQSFIVNLGGNTSEGFVLYKVAVKKTARQAALSSMSTFSGMKGSKAMIPATMKLLQPGIYEIVPDGKLEKGEYLFALKSAGTSLSSTTTDVYAFGID